jgi:hypothetical protein
MAQRSYLLRFWRTPNSEDWRATLVSVTPDATELHFTTVEELLIYLRRSYLPLAELAEAAPPKSSEEDVVV